MSSSNETVEIEGTPVRTGTAVYDTEYDRVLWVTGIDDTGITVEPAADYDATGSTGSSSARESNIVTDGTAFGVDDFTTMVIEGRFEISPR